MAEKPVVVAPVKRACKGCDYFNLLDDKKRVGQCRREPPNIEKVVVVRSSPTVLLESRWPLCYTDEWCGEYKAG